MLIGIEAERANAGQKTGVEHYAKQLILHLANSDTKNSYILYLRTAPERWLLDLPRNFQVKVMPLPIFWTQLRVSWELFFHPVDVLFIPASALPIIHPKKSVVTIHDLGWKYFPKSFTWFMRNFLEASTRFAIKNAAQIIAVSESTKKDLLKHYSISPEKISVIHHGFEPAGSASVNFKSILGLPEKYVLFLSTLQPRKNLVRLINAFRAVKNENPELPHKLLVVGKPGWKFDEILSKINTNNDIVVYLNHISDSDKIRVLQGADLLVLPSLYEGFGMQILEAFEYSVPVATSNISSMPEVAQDAAVYFDPTNEKEIAKAIKMVLMDKSLADKLRENGKKRLQNFSWDKCAKETLEIMTKIS